MILVTGGTGLVGAHILYELTRSGNIVRATYRNRNNIQKVEKIFSYYPKSEDLYGKIYWSEADICNYYSLNEAFNEVDRVYHCAAMVTFNPRKRKNVLKNNIKGTENVVNICLERNIKKLLHVSSIASLEHPEDSNITDENDKWKNSKGKSAYSISKFKSEMEIWRGINEGLDALIVNPSVIIGPGDWSNGSPSIIATIANGLKFYLPGMTGFVDVRDVAKASVQLMDGEIINERFILNSENLTYLDVFKNIAEKLNVRPPKILVGKFIASLTWRFVKLFSLILNKEPKITRETVASGFNTAKYSNEKIIEKLNFSFNSIDKAIENACRCYEKDQNQKT